MIKVWQKFVLSLSWLCLASCSIYKPHSVVLIDAISTIELNTHRKELDGKKILIDGYVSNFVGVNGFLLIHSKVEKSQSGATTNYCLGDDNTDLYFEKPKAVHNLKHLDHRHVKISGIYINRIVEVYNGISYFFSGELKDVKIEMIYNDSCVPWPVIK